jgi:hypothetical protein
MEHTAYVLKYNDLYFRDHDLTYFSEPTSIGVFNQLDAGTATKFMTRRQVEAVKAFVCREMDIPRDDLLVEPTKVRASPIVLNYFAVKHNLS